MVKSIVSGVVAVGCLALVAFEKKLGLELGNELRVTLVMAALGAAGLGAVSGRRVVTQRKEKQAPLSKELPPTPPAA
jgi:hypothetical protein